MVVLRLNKAKITHQIIGEISSSLYICMN